MSSATSASHIVSSTSSKGNFVCWSEPCSLWLFLVPAIAERERERGLGFWRRDLNRKGPPRVLGRQRLCSRLLNRRSDLIESRTGLIYYIVIELYRSGSANLIRNVFYLGWLERIFLKITFIWYESRKEEEDQWDRNLSEEDKKDTVNHIQKLLPTVLLLSNRLKRCRERERRWWFVLLRRVSQELSSLSSSSSISFAARFDLSFLYTNMSFYN